MKSLCFNPAATIWRGSFRYIAQKDSLPNLPFKIQIFEKQQNLPR
jgi:hypothetical protein